MLSDDKGKVGVAVNDPPKKFTVAIFKGLVADADRRVDDDAALQLPSGS